MTRRRNFKRLVRARMRKTGESYTSARARMLGHAGPPPSHGGGVMHPFDRLDRHARQALDLARWHTLHAGREEIDTDSLAWALTHQSDGGAAVVLARLRVSCEPAPPGWQRAGSDQRRPGVTAAMRDAIRHAYAEAADAGGRHVGSEHLLLGMLEADPEAASRLGVATADLVRLQVQQWRQWRQWRRFRRMATGRLPVHPLPDVSPELNAQLTHLLHEIGEATQLRAAAVLLDRLGGPSRPPAAAMELLWELEDVQRRKDDARIESDDETLERLSGEEARLQHDVYVALAAWHARLHTGDDDAPGGAAAPD